MVIVTVSDPQEQGEGRNRHTTYLVEVLPSSAEEVVSVDVTANKTLPFAAGSSVKCVRRRYSDFQWLYNRLNIERPGAVVPIIPHRRAVGLEARLAEELVAERRAHLETFLRRVVTHPELADSPSLAAFLRAGGDAWDAAKRELDKDSPNAASYDADNNNNSSNDRFVSPDAASTARTIPSSPEKPRHKIRDLFAKTAMRVSVLGGGAELQKTDDEPEIEEVEHYVEGLLGQVRTLANQASALVKNDANTASGLNELKDTFHTWALTHQAHYCPGSADNTVLMFQKISSKTNELAKIQSDRVQAETAQFDERMQDLMRIVQALRHALQCRREKQLTYTTRLKQIASRQATLDKLRAKTGRADSAYNKVEAAETDLKNIERLADMDREELDVISKRVLREVERIKDDIDFHIRTTMLEYARIQVEYNRKSEESWALLLPNLETKEERQKRMTMPNAPPPPPPPPSAPALSSQQGSGSFVEGDFEIQDLQDDTGKNDSVKFI